tara:strand:+ start:140 stop:373 length:234 start_codon:yes stop_codon:yes gene_type:complete
LAVAVAEHITEVRGEQVDRAEVALAQAVLEVRVTLLFKVMWVVLVTLHTKSVVVVVVLARLDLMAAMERLRVMAVSV